MDAGTGPDVDDVVGGAHRVLVVLDDNEGVADVAQMFEGSDELVVVPLVQANARLVEDVEHPDKRGTDLGCEPDALALPARQGARGTGEGEIVEPDAAQEFQPFPDFLEHRVGNHVVALAQLEVVEEVEHPIDAQVGQVGDVFLPHRDSERLLFEPLSVAARAVDAAHIVGDFLFGILAVALLITPLQVVDDPLKRRVVAAGAVVVGAGHPDFFPFGAVEDDVDRFLGQVLERGVERKAVVLGEALKVHVGNRPFVSERPAARLDRPLCNRKIFVGDDQVGVDLHKGADAGTLFAGAVGIVERKHPGRELLNTHPVLGAGVVLGEEDFLPADHVDDHKAARQVGGDLKAVGQAGFDLRLDDQPVDDNFNVVLFVFLQLDAFGEVVEVAVHPDADKAALAGRLKLLDMLPFAAADDRRENLCLTPFGQAEHLIDDLVHRLLLDLPAADRAVRDADAGVEQTEVVIDFGHGADGGTGVFGGCLLVDRNRGGKALDVVDVRLLHLPEELPGIGGEALDIPSLPVGVDGVKREGGLSRAGQAGEDDKLVARDFQVDVFQVVFAGAANRNLILSQLIKSFI